ncbi:MAG TPA: hypothetical protein VM055_05200 [Novosphingobium sp.]|nr:hypothetical protein [Novosphingobium sp.]
MFGLNPTQRLLAASSAIALTLAASPATAQTPGGEQSAPAQPGARTSVYDAAFFAQFAPANALDIVRRVPGFAVEDSNGEVRGFAGAAGNVVFNGARPSSKSDSLQTILMRIPARRVIRVEVGPGDLYGSDYSGKSQVLNVILSAEGGVDGNVTLKATRLYTGRVIPNLEASALIRRGSSSFNLAAANGNHDYVEEGFDEVFALPSRTLVEHRDKVNVIHPHDPYVSASWGMEIAPDRAVHLNGRYAPSTLKLFQTNRVTPVGGPVRDDRLVQDYTPTAYELGGDISRPLARGTVKLVVLGNRRDRETYDASFNRIGGETVGGFEQLSKSRYDEALGRLSWTRGALLGFAVETGAEAAYNRLENETSLFVLGPAGARTPIDLPIDQAVVDEVRTESYVNAGRALGKTLRLDARLAYETSSLEVSGDAQAQRSLAFFKPGVTLDWKPKGGWHAQLIARRSVAQLNFFDFVSNAELSVGRVNGGNAELEPQRSWETRLTIEHPVLGRGLVKLELGHDLVSKLQDRILTADGFDAPGNLGTGTRNFARITLDAPLDSIGLKGFNFRTDNTFQKTRVRDPLSGETRGWSGFWPSYDLYAELRRDVGKTAVGASIGDRDQITFFRTDEIDSNFNHGPFVNVFAEYRPDPRTTLRLDLDNALDSTGNRRRFFFDPNRSAPTPFAEEYRSRANHLQLTLTLRRGFGSGAAQKG